MTKGQAANVKPVKSIADLALRDNVHGDRFAASCDDRDGE